MSNPSPSAGSDYVLVPREPTEEMIDAACGAWVTQKKRDFDMFDETSFGRLLLIAYKAMLTAAPAPVLVIELDQPRIADGDQCNEQQPHAPSPVSRDVRALVDAMWQLLDDMSERGQSVCLVAKADARIAFEPFLDSDNIVDGWMTLAEAKKVLKEVDR